MPQVEQKQIRAGLIIEPVAPEDYILGSDQSLETKFGGEVLQPDGNWKAYLPDTEKQAPGYETSSCVPHATLNAVEVLSNRLFKDGNNLSDRYLAKIAGVDPLRGSSPKKVADTLYRLWTVLEQDWPTKKATSTDEFYAEPPAHLKAVALALGSEYSYGYEWVTASKSSIRQALKYSPVCISVPAWFKDDNGKYYGPEGVQDGHWTLCYGINDESEYLIYDTYEPHLKVMRSDFIPSMAMRYHLAKRAEGPISFKKFILLIRKLLRL